MIVMVCPRAAPITLFLSALPGTNIRITDDGHIRATDDGGYRQTDQGLLIANTGPRHSSDNGLTLSTDS